MKPEQVLEEIHKCIDLLDSYGILKKNDEMAMSYDLYVAYGQLHCIMVYSPKYANDFGPLIIACKGGYENLVKDLANYKEPTDVYMMRDYSTLVNFMCAEDLSKYKTGAGAHILVPISDNFSEKEVRFSLVHFSRLSDCVFN